METATKRKPTPHSKQYSTKKKRKKKKTNQNLIVYVIIFFVLIFTLFLMYFIGRSKYDGKFLPNTFINDVNVGGKSLSEVEALFIDSNAPKNLTVIKQNGEKVEIDFEDFGYSYDTQKLLDEIYSKQNHNTWFSGFGNSYEYTFSNIPKYDETRLKSQLKSADWGSAANEDAKIELTNDGYVIVDAVQGDEMDYSILESYIISQLNNNIYEINAFNSGCYVLPTVNAKDLEDECARDNKIFQLSITYDFDYTTETLTGKNLAKLVEIDEDGNITANEEKVMEYVKTLADKYDTYNTERKFHATIQGDITVPVSSDAKYGWWIDKQLTCDHLVEMLEAGEKVEKVDPIYYEHGTYVFTGVESARSKNDDIGDTYIELDLTNQTFWYYKKGKKIKECYIVSGQTTSEARTTLPGVYKVWNKATNYRMKDTNSEGDSWDTTCNYWTRVAIVGIGLHDSTWRSYFGGSIYKYDGSHGCINMPYDFAKFVHDEVPMGTPCVMYY